MCVLPLSYEPIDLFVIWTDWGPLRGAQAVEDEKRDLYGEMMMFLMMMMMIIGT